MTLEEQAEALVKSVNLAFEQVRKDKDEEWRSRIKERRDELKKVMPTDITPLRRRIMREAKIEELEGLLK